MWKNRPEASIDDTDDYIEYIWWKVWGRWPSGHDSPYDTITGWFQEADSKVIYLNCNS